MLVKRYRFRDLVLVPAARELWRGDALVPLPSSAFDCLVYLVAHRDRAVGRDELISAVWGRADVADTLLAQTVMRVRRALGDSGSDGAIRTVARFGYRWVEETVELGEADDDAVGPDVVGTGVGKDEPGPQPAASVPMEPIGQNVEQPAEVAVDAPVASPPARRSTTVPLVLVTAALVWIVAFALWRWVLPLSAPTAPPDTAPAAASDTAAPAFVLPALAPDTPDWRWLRIGLMDLIGNRLRQGGLPTAPSESVLAQLASGASADAALRIEPHATITDGQWRIRLQLHRGDEAASVEAAGPDVLQAARAAADLLLVRLGHAPPAGGELPRPLALEQLLQQTRAAILADQFDLARHLLAQAPPDLQDEPELALRAAQIAAGQGDDTGAEATLRQALERVPDTQPALRGRMLVALGSAQFRRHRLDGAQASYAEAIGLLEAARDPLALGAAYSGRAALAAAADDSTTAAADLARARVEMEAAGDSFGLAQVDMNLGLIEASEYRPAQAQRVLLDAEARIATLGAREELAYVRYALVGIHLQLLDRAKAEATVARLLPAEAVTGNTRLRRQILLAQAAVHADAGRLSEAEGLLQSIAEDEDALPTIRDTANVRLAQTLLLHGRPGDALAATDRVDPDSVATHDPDLYISLSTARATAQRALGRTDDAAATLAALQTWVTAHPNPWRRVHATLADAEHAWATHDATALARFDDAFAQAAALGIPDDLVATGTPYALALIDAGDLDRAATVVGRIAPWAETDLRAAIAQTRLYRAQSRVDAWRAGTERVLRLAGERSLPAPAIE